MKLLYRIVNGLLALAVLPVAFFADLLYLEVSPTFLDYGLKASLSIYRFINTMLGKDSEYGWIVSLIKNDDGDFSFSFPAAFDPYKGWLIATGACFIFAVLVAIFIVVWSCCSKNRWVSFASSGVGFASVIAMRICFSKFANPLLDGTINVADLFAEDGSSGFLSGLIGGLVSVDTFEISFCATIILVLYIGLLLWSLADFLVTIGEQPEAPKKSKR